MADIQIRLLRADEIKCRVSMVNKNGAAFCFTKMQGQVREHLMKHLGYLVENVTF